MHSPQGTLRNPPGEDTAVEPPPRQRFLNTLEQVKLLHGWKVTQTVPGTFRVTNPSGRSAKFVIPGIRTEEHLAKRMQRLRRLQLPNRLPDLPSSRPAPVPTPPARRIRPDLAVDEVLADMPDAATRLCRAARAKATRRMQRNGESGLVWRGDVFILARQVWPDIPDTRSHPSSQRLLMELLSYLGKKGFLLVLPRQDDASPTEWWIADASDEPEPLNGDASAERPPSRAAFSKPGGVVATTPPERPTVKLHQCRNCCFTDSSRQALSSHERSTPLRDDEHPQDEHAPFRCSETGCHAVRPTVDSFLQHLRSARHNKRGFICREQTCLKWFSEEDALRTHQVTAGHHAVKKPAERKAALPAASFPRSAVPAPSPAPDQATAGPAPAPVPTVPTPVPAAPSRPPETPAGQPSLDEVMGMVKAYAASQQTGQADKIARLEARVAQLERTNEELRAFVKQFQAQATQLTD